MTLTRAALAAVWVLLPACGARTTIEAGGSEQAGDTHAPPSGSRSETGGGNPEPEANGMGGADPRGFDTTGAGAGTGMSGSAAGTAGHADKSSGSGAGGGAAVDRFCNEADARTGNPCVASCVAECGYGGLGTRTCTCVGGIYTSCPCPRPAAYRGAAVAPTCSTPDGRTHWIDHTSCMKEWDQCIGTDPVQGVTPRGCACLVDPVSMRLRWTCASTNRWFLPE